MKNKHKCSFFPQFISANYRQDILELNLEKSLNWYLKNAGTTLLDLY